MKFAEPLNNQNGCLSNNAERFYRGDEHRQRDEGKHYES
jgi:hypothetical protein